MSKRKGRLSLGAFLMSPDTMLPPELRRRGLFRTGTTLRDHLGLKRPAGRFAGQAVAAE